MANQGLDRRTVLEMLAKAAAASQFPGFSRWCYAAQNQQQSSSTSKPAYTPQFFSADEYRTIDQLTEIIIPKDDTPGAHEVGVAEFIDFMAAHDDDVQEPFRKGLHWLNKRARNLYGQPYSKLPATDQQAILRRLAYKAEQSPDETEGQQFFLLLRSYTVMGYYTTRAGLEQLDYPGLRMYSSSPACPHKNDPEHRHLTARP